MGQPVVHFEVLGKDGAGLWSFYSDLFGWQIDTDNPLNYGTISPDGTKIGGGIGVAPEGYPGHVTFYVGCPTSRPRWPRRRALAGPG